MIWLKHITPGIRHTLIYKVFLLVIS